MSMTSQREDTTLNVDRDILDLLGILAVQENRTKKGEIAFLVKERARKLGVKA
ncbi:hypothetical protein NTE_03386 [Candidatus Nitrososphaera evergladensis SR1]|uniref:Uncharacterized protein n=1 Tax=Candidatus Nitrososphaera evergladensis SR1 TaxID=1459636 RepID=A0A075N1T1_9ARCH|nr:hypothetical protein [Candidatus Nitrososphaera evergladensis]AIF85414.1 hypothetical protein NTE_03386 [Candidatus Nitrososphaera evergladensis SR1]